MGEGKNAVLMNVGLVTKRAELTTEEFVQVWAGPYAEMILSHDEVCFYMQCVVTDARDHLSTLTGAAVPHDLMGIALVGFEDMDALGRMRGSSAMKTAPAFASEFCGTIASEFCTVDRVRPIAATGFASFSNGPPSQSEADLELHCRAQSQQPQHFAGLALHQSSTDPTDSILCERSVMRSPLDDAMTQPS